MRFWAVGKEASRNCHRTAALVYGTEDQFFEFHDARTVLLAMLEGPPEAGRPTGWPSCTMPWVPMNCEPRPNMAVGLIHQTPSQSPPSVTADQYLLVNRGTGAVIGSESSKSSMMLIASQLPSCEEVAEASSPCCDSCIGAPRGCRRPRTPSTAIERTAGVKECRCLPRQH